MIEIDQNKIFENSKDQRFQALTLSFKRLLGLVFEEISKNISLVSLLKVLFDQDKIPLLNTLNLEYKRQVF